MNTPNVRCATLAVKVLPRRGARRRAVRCWRDSRAVPCYGGSNEGVHMTSSTKPATEVVHGTRDPSTQAGFVNAPVYRGSTVLFPTMDALERRAQAYTYGRFGNPTTVELETAIASLEGGETTVLTANGLQAVTTALLAFVKTGDHILMTDSVYFPTRTFCDKVLSRLGISTTYYDPLIGTGIGSLIRPETTVIFTESPGSQTFEMQDIPAIAAIARARGAWLLMDNTWASPLYFKPFTHGVDVSIQALTKYVVGHSDALLGSITANARAAPHIKSAKQTLGVCPGSEETWLALRGLRTLDVRLARHHSSGLAIAQWLSDRPEVAKVLHPALPTDPGHAVWQRDYLGASGLFSVVLHPVDPSGLAAMLDNMRLFKMGFSWGGFESLIIPFDPSSYRTATRWTEPGPALRLHIGLEDIDDLKADLSDGLARLRQTR
jgi:cysteine-S-conjugate beta-lyase